MLAPNGVLYLWATPCAEDAALNESEDIMASVDKNQLNGVGRTTDIHAGGEPIPDPFGGQFVFGMDAFPAFAFQSPIFRQNIDAAYGRAINAGRGLVGEGGDAGPGVVGIAGNVIPRPEPRFPRDLQGGPQLGRGFTAGVIGFGTDPVQRGGGAAIGVLGVGAVSVGVWGASSAVPGVVGQSGAHSGVYGFSGTTGVIGDGSAGQVGVEGFGNQYGVYGHLVTARPNADGVGVFGAAVPDLNNLDNYIGRAGAFVGPVDVIGNLTCTGDLVVWGAKSAAARHTDGSHRLMYAVESAQSQFEDFGEAKLVKGRALVKLDRNFAALADMSQYLVFITPCGDSNGLYVTERNTRSFQVREQGGGKSDIGFAYRIVARRKHVSTIKWQKATRPKAPKMPEPAARPELPFRLDGDSVAAKRLGKTARKLRKSKA